MSSHISYSQIKTFKECPKKYYFAYIDEASKRGAPTPLMLEGSEKHKALEDLSQIPEKAKPIVEKYFTNPVTEEQLSYPMLITDIVGVIDLYSITGTTAYVIDWKLNHIPDDDLQLKIYAFLLSKKYPGLEQFICWFFSINQGYYKRYTYLKEDIDAFESELFEIITQITEAEEYPEKPSTACSYCPYVEKCHAINKYETIPTLRTIEEAKAFAQKLMIAEGLVNKGKEMLKEFLLNTGLSELPVDEENRYYLSASITMRAGKMKTKKRRVAKR